MAETQASTVEGGLDNLFERFQNSLRAELRKQEEKTRELEAALARCRKENVALKAKLETPNHNEFTFQARRDTQSESTEKTSKPAEDTVAYSTYALLQDQYQETWQNLKNMTTAYEHYKTKYKNAKNMIRPWQEYARRCERKWKEKEQGLSAVVLATSDPPIPTRDVSHLSTSTANSATAPARQDAEEGLDSPPTVLQGQQTGYPLEPRPRLKAVISSHSDSPETDSTVIQHAVEDDNILEEYHFYPPANAPTSSQTEDCVSPILHSQYRTGMDISTSALKKDPDPPSRKVEPTLVESERAGDSVAAAITIKSEPNSSPYLPTVQTFPRTDTMDLDDAGEHIDTPRKKRHMEAIFRDHNIFSFPGPAAGYSPRIQNHMLELCNKSDLQGGISSAGAKPSLRQPVGTRKMQQPEASMPTTPSPLQPISPNRHDLPRGKHPSNKLNCRRQDDFHKSAVASVAEDGDMVLDRFKVASPQSRQKANILIGDLLEHGTPLTRAMITPTTTQTFSARLDASNDSPSFERNAISKVFKPPPQLMLTPMSDSSKRSWENYVEPTEDNLHPQKRHKPDPEKFSNQPGSALRARPLELLKPEDFKLNPRSHGDIDLEAMEPVRNREDRRHMHGCIDSDCHQCGRTLRALAEDLSVTVGSSLFASTQEQDMTDEERLLYYHLGTTYDRDRVSRMNAHKKAELVLEAKRHVLAERYGRHKIRPGARAKSPPGFWDVDMPTTQDMESRAEEVERRRIETVKTRRREAMRPGGRWIFKDE